MSKFNFESSIEHLVVSKYRVAGATQSNKIEFKERICKNILRYLTKEDDVEVITSKKLKVSDTSEASGSLLVEKYNIKITIKVSTNSISAHAIYLGNEEKIKGKSKKLISFGGELVKSTMTSNQFGYFEEFLRVKTVEFIDELDKLCNCKLIDSEFEKNIRF